MAPTNEDYYYEGSYQTGDFTFLLVCALFNDLGEDVLNDKKGKLLRLNPSEYLIEFKNI
jgi:hypothetical protein